MATLKVTNIKNESFAGDQLYLKSDGRLGIGTTSPSTKLHVSAGHINIDSGYSFQWGDSHERIEQSDGKIEFFTGNGEKMTLSSDYLGIGTSSPQSLIHTFSGSSSGGLFLASNGCNAYIWAIQNAGNLINGSTAGRMGLRSANGFDFSANNGTSIHLDIDSSGNATFKGDITVSDANPIINFTDTNNDSDFRIQVEAGTFHIEDTTNAGADRLTINSSGDIEVGGNLKTNNLPGRNLIINGAFQISQRATTSTGGDYCVVDRFGISNNGLDEATTNSHHDLTSSDTGPWEEGFRHSFHVQNGNQTGGAGADDRVSIYYKPEAQDIANSGWNYTSASSYITLSFWVKSSVAQNFYGRFTTEDGSVYSWPFETGSLSANTWTKVTKVIPGNANLTFDNNVAIGATLEWNAFRGTNKTGSIALNTWAAFVSSVRVPDMTSTWYTTNDATFEITGVQLEVGSIATKFDHNSYAKELTRCQRYYWKIKQDGGGNAAFLGIAAGYGSGNYNLMCLQNPVEMRVPCSSIDTSGTAGDYQLWGGNAVEDLLAVPSLRVTNSMLQTSLDLSYGTSAGEARVCRIKASTSAYLGFNAEL